MRKVILAIIINLTLAGIASANSINMVTYMPVPRGSFYEVKTKLLTIEPQTTLNGACDPGSMYVDSTSNELHFCLGSGTWGWPNGVWKQSGDIISITDTTNPLLKKVGIGTAAPNFKLHLKNNGGIIAEGTYQSASNDNLTVAGAGTRFVWYPKKATLLAGSVSGTQWDDANLAERSVAFGYDNTIKTKHAYIFGGWTNIIDPVEPTDITPKVIVSGAENEIHDSYGFIGQGFQNKIHNGGYNTIVSGLGNEINSSPVMGYNFIGGGNRNVITSNYSVIAGGGYEEVGDGGNTISGDWSSILGGRKNSTSVHNYVSIGGGHSNAASGSGSTIAGGENNSTTGSYSTVSGGGNPNPGEGNKALGTYATVSGGGGPAIGDGNRATASYATVGGGIKNTASNTAATIAGGSINTASGIFSTIAGGNRNAASGLYSFIGGGGDNDTLTEGNEALSDYTVVAGGWNNRVEPTYSSILGGYNNEVRDRPAAAGSFSLIGGGQTNFTKHQYTVISGGLNNRAYSHGSTVAGGKSNTAGVDSDVGSLPWPGDSATVSGGQSNTASGKFSTVPGGQNNIAGGDYSWAGGQNMQLTAAAIGTFAWGNSLTPQSITTPNSFIIFPAGTGNVGIGTPVPNYKLDVRGTIGNNTTLYHSDIRWKDNVHTISGALDKILNLRGVYFDWRKDEFPEMNFEDGYHIGFIAQEVETVLPELVSTTKDGYKTVEYSNIVAVLVEAIKEQQKEIDMLKDRLNQLENPAK